MIDAKCSVAIEPVLELLEGKWTLLILRDLFNGIKRFGELRRSLHPISPKTLTDRLRLLEERGIVTRTLFTEVPLHVEYELTENGQRLQPIFAAMMAWIDPALGSWDFGGQQSGNEANPAASEPAITGMIEAPIMLGREEATNELKHFVGGEPVEAGSYMEMKFGDEWIRGRYEWSLGKDSLIQIHSGRDEVFYIREGHWVRVKGEDK